MAWTVKYIRSDGQNGDGASNTSVSAWTLAYALNQARTYGGTPTHFHVIADGTHVITADINAEDGFDDGPIWFEGRTSADAVIAPSRNSAGKLVTTGMPAVSMSSGARWQIGDYSFIDRLNVSGNDDVLLYYGSYVTLANCRVYNAKSSGNIYMFYPTTDYRVINCDFEDYDGGSQNILAVGALGLQVVGCRFTVHSTSSSIEVVGHNQRSHFNNNVFAGNATGTVIAIADAAANGRYGSVIKNNTFYKCNKCLEDRDGSEQGPFLIVQNVVWDCDYFCFNPYATEHHTIITGKNAIDSGVTAAYGGTTKDFNRIVAVSDLSLSADPFNDAANGDFSLTDANLIGACPTPYMDLGALQGPE